MEQWLDTGWIKQECQDVPEYEMDIEATKIEESVIDKIKPEFIEEQMDLRYQKITCNVKESPRTHSADVKSNNPRTKMRELHQRLLKLEMAVKSGNGAVSSRSFQNACQTTKAKSNLPEGSLSPAEHMRDLRQRLMKLEKCNKFPDIRARKTSNQHRREMQQRLLKLVGTDNNLPVKLSHESSKITGKRSAQRMPELRPLTYDSQDINDNNNKNDNYRPQTPPVIDVQRMREFRLRLLKLNPIDVQLINVKKRNTKAPPIGNSAEGTAKAANC